MPKQMSNAESSLLTVARTDHALRMTTICQSPRWEVTPAITLICNGLASADAMHAFLVAVRSIIRAAVICVSAYGWAESPC